MGDARGPLPRFLAPLTWALARAYGAAVARRNAAYDRGEGVERLEVGGTRPHVVSIGNLTAGGTGKSPMVAWCATVAAEAGALPVIALRGYRAGPDARSDEAEEYAATSPGAMVVVGARRREALEAALAGSAGSAERALVILDDGFQHRRLARDLDVVLVDATRPGLGGDLLPNGWLREPADRIARADLVILTKADDPAARARAAALVADARGRPHDAACVHAWRSLTLVAAPGAESPERGATNGLPTAWLRGRVVLSACALGNPDHFHAMVERSGARVAGRLVRPDHRAFALGELERAAERAGTRTVVTSRKDLVKIAGLPSSRLDVVVPELGISFVEGEGRLRASIAGLAQRPKRLAERVRDA